MKKQIIRLTENDLHSIITESVKMVLKENETNEGKFGRGLATAALGATLSMLPMNSNAQELSKKSHPEMVSKNFNAVYDTIRNCTKENLELIRTAEDIMKNDDDMAEAIKAEAVVTDETDNFITINDKRNKSYLSKLLDMGDFGMITVYDDGRKFANCLVDIEKLKDILSEW